MLVFWGFLAFATVFGLFEMRMDNESSRINALGVPMEGRA